MTNSTNYIPMFPGMKQQPTYWEKQHDCFLDITPYVRTASGDRVRLGTVRYLVPVELSGGMADGQVVWNQPQNWLRGHPNSSHDVGVEFEVKVTWADAPQPETLIEQQIPDDNLTKELVADKPKYDYPGLRNAE